MEILQHYSNTPELLHDLRATLRALTEPDDLDSELRAAEQVAKPWSMDERLTKDQVGEIICRYHAGALGQELANDFHISLSSVRRLLRKHGARLKDRPQRE